MEKNNAYSSLRGASAGMITIKAFYKTEIRRLPILNPELTFDELFLLLQRLFKMPKGDFSLQYKDNEGDWIQLVEDSDIIHAVSLSNVVSVRIYPPPVSLDSADDIQALTEKINDTVDQLNSLLSSLALLAKKPKGPAAEGTPKSSPEKGPQIKQLTTTDLAEFLNERKKSPQNSAGVSPAIQSQQLPPSKQKPAEQSEGGSAQGTPQSQRPQSQSPQSHSLPPNQQGQSSQQQPVPHAPVQSPPVQQQQMSGPPQQQQLPPEQQQQQQQYYQVYGYPPMPQQQMPRPVPIQTYQGYPPSPSQAYPPNAPPNSGYPQQYSSLQPLPPSLSQGLPMPHTLNKPQ